LTDFDLNTERTSPRTVLIPNPMAGDSTGSLSSVWSHQS